MNIAEVALKFNLAPSTLRYYEKVGLIPAVTRKAGGVRVYEEEDLKWIEFIKCMRTAGLSIDSLVRYNQLFQIGEDTLQERKGILLSEYQNLVLKQQEINATVERLRQKLQNYEHMIAKYENSLEFSPETIEIAGV